MLHAFPSHHYIRVWTLHTPAAPKWHLQVHKNSLRGFHRGEFIVLTDSFLLLGHSLYWTRLCMKLWGIILCDVVSHVIIRLIFSKISISIPSLAYDGEVWGIYFSLVYVYAFYIICSSWNGTDKWNCFWWNPKSISWLLMIWWHKDSGHHQPWYKPSLLGAIYSSDGYGKTFCAATRIFQDSFVNTMAAYALAADVARSSATMIFIIQDIQALAFYEEIFQLPVRYQCGEFITNATISLYFPKEETKSV